MWPPVPAEASWSAGFERFVRTCAIVCLAVVAGAVAGGVGVYATVGPDKASRNVPVEARAASEFELEQTRADPGARLAAQADAQIAAQPSAAMAEVLPVARPERSAALRPARVKPLFGPHGGAPGSATRTVLLGAVAPQTDQRESVPPAPAPQAANDREAVPAATPEVASSDAAAPRSDERPSPPRAMKKAPRAVATAAAATDPTLPLASAQKPARPHAAGVAAAQPRPAAHPQPHNPIGALFGALFGVPRTSATN